MDISLNITTNVVAKKPVEKSKDNNNFANKKKVNKNFKQGKKNDNTPNNQTFNFKWDTNTKQNKKSFVIKPKDGKQNNSKKPQNIIEMSSESNNNTSSSSPQKNKPQTEENISKLNQSHDNTSNNQTFEFKWDTNTKQNKKSFVIKTKDGKKNNSEKSQNIIKMSSESNNNSSSSSPQKNKPQTEENISKMNQFRKQGFPLFDKFSEAAKGTTYAHLDGKSKVEQVFSKRGTKFKDLGIHPHTVTNLERIGLTVLTTIQERAIPEVMAGKNVFVRSQTGSGKTLAYAIPIVESLRNIEPHINRKDGIQALIVVPTRELALQTYELFLKLVEPFRWIVPGRLCGGENRSSEKARLRKGISILIGTPGRLLDHALHSQNLKLDKVRCLVLDEADRLLDMGFQKDVNKLIEQINESKNLDYDPIAIMKSNKKLNNPDQEPEIEKNIDSLPPLLDIKSKNRQTVLLSATLTSNVKDLATFTLTDYVYIDPLNPNSQVDVNNLPDQEDTNNVAIPESVRQEFVVTDVKTRLVVLSAFIVGKALEENCKMFIFMASRQMVEYHETLFKKCLVKRPKKEKSSEQVKITLGEEEEDSDDEEEENAIDIQFLKLHGSMDQKERTEVFKKFRDAKNGVLLCTDVAARGVDIPHADYVIQYTSPSQDDDYIHRVGRTGRAGKKGLALLFLTEPELSYVMHLKEKNIILKREKQDKILRYLLPFMEHSQPGSIQSAAEILQRRYEKAVLNDKNLHRAACLAYTTWSRYYSAYPQNLRKYFSIKNVHLGHYVTSFALREAPQQVARIARAEVGKTDDVRLNKKLDNHESEEQKVVKPLRPKKRPRDQELVMSEFDSGLPKSKKKKNSKK